MCWVVGKGRSAKACICKLFGQVVLAGLLNTSSSLRVHIAGGQVFSDLSQLYLRSDAPQCISD